MQRHVLVASTLLAALALGGCGRPPIHAPVKTPSTSIPEPIMCDVLQPRLTTSEGAAGTQYVHLELTNTGRSPCHVRGYPRLTLVDGDGKTLGTAATRRGDGGAAMVIIQPGKTVGTDIGFPNAGNFLAGACKTGTKALVVQLSHSKRTSRVADVHPFCPDWSVGPLR